MPVNLSVGSAPLLLHNFDRGEDEPLGQPRGALGDPRSETAAASTVVLQRHPPPHGRHDGVEVLPVNALLHSLPEYAARTYDEMKQIQVQGKQIFVHH